MVENFVGTGENPGYQYFLLFPQCFQKASVSGCSKSGLYGKPIKAFYRNLSTRRMSSKSEVAATAIQVDTNWLYIT